MVRDEALDVGQRLVLGELLHVVPQEDAFVFGEAGLEAERFDLGRLSDARWLLLYFRPLVDREGSRAWRDGGCQGALNLAGGRSC